MEALTQALGAQLAGLRQELSSLALELRAGLETKTATAVFEQVTEQLRSAQQNLQVQSTSTALVGEPLRGGSDDASEPQRTTPESRADLEGQVAVLRQEVSGLLQKFASMEQDVREELCRVHDEYKLASRGVGEALVEHRDDQNRVFELAANHAMLSAKLTRHLAEEEDQREERWEHLEESLNCLDAQLRADFAHVFVRTDQHVSLKEDMKTQVDLLRHEV